MPLSTSTMPSSVSKAVTPLNRDWNQVRSATSIGPPDQKKPASSADFPRMALKRSDVGLATAFSLGSFLYAETNALMDTCHADWSCTSGCMAALWSSGSGKTKLHRVSKLR